ncbi:TOMM biosynthesis dehydrogenase protein B [Minicystis rosea]|nr:TOMM biosynthesis dehydrogenase protein B [Minicystis rosea]
MARSKETDLARLYHLSSSNVRARSIETGVTEDDKPLCHRTFPGAPRTALPGRDFEVDVPFREVLARRRSVRRFARGPLPLAALGRLLYASHGVWGRRRTEGLGLWERPAPSAGGLHPIEIYVATQDVEGLADGVHHYDARAHELEEVRGGRVHEQLVELTLEQDMLRDANVVCVITAVRERTMFKYGQRGYRYLFLDAGHVGQNLYLVATALGLGPVGIGGFLDAEVNEMCRLPAGEEAIYLVGVGRPAEER